MRVAFLIALAAASQLVACTRGGTASEPKTEEEKVTYALGVALGQNVLPFELTEQEMVMVRAGLTDAVKNAPKIELEELEETYVPKLRELAEARSKVAMERDKKAGSEVLAKTASEAGAVKTDSGMVYKPVKEGTGESPKATDTVKVHYHGTFAANDKVFDSSKDRGEPVEFPLNMVIPCWTEGLQKMKVGGTAKLVCPPDLAYGEQGQPPQMPGGATLVFEVELLEIMKEPAAGAMPPAAQ